MEQLSFFDLLTPASTPASVKAWEPPPRRAFTTRAYGVEKAMEIGADERDPIEISVRGIPTLVRFASFFQVYAIEPPGSAYWSETGFRSFCGVQDSIDGELTPQIIAQIIDADIDSKHGCNGKLTKWWPSYCLQWRQNRSFAERLGRERTWAQWGPEMQAECWASHDAAQSSAISRMQAEAIDPDDVWSSRK